MVWWVLQGLSAYGATLTVCGGGCTHAGVQAAINAAGPTDTIEVSQGTWGGAAINAKNLTLVGVDGAALTTLSAAGDAVTVTNATVSFEGFTITGNRGVVGNGATVDLTDVQVANCPAGGSVWTNSSTLNGLRVTFVGNTAATDGGAIWAQNSTIDLDDSFITGNTSNDQGGIYMTGAASALDLDNCELTGNRAPNNDGAAVYIAGGTMDVIDSLFEDNVGLDAGPAIYGLTNAGPITSFNNIFRLNKGGYGQWFGRVDFVDTESVFDRGDSVNGGGITLYDGATLTQTDSSIVDSISANRGGAIHMTNSLSLTLDGVTYADNTAPTSGGHIWVDDPNSISTVDIDHSSLTGGSSDLGGGIHLATNADATLYDVTLSGNQASTRGGALLVDADVDTALVIDSFLTNNTAPEGAAIYGGLVGAVGNVVCNNDVRLSGGAWTNNEHVDAPFTVVGTAIIENNSFIASPVALSAGTTDFRNNLVAWTTGTTGALQMSGAVTLDHNAWFANSPADVSGGSPGGNAVFADPMLTSWTDDGMCNDDLRQLLGSPLTDAGDPAIVDPDGTTSDIGAYGGPLCFTDIWYADVDGDGYGGAALDTCAAPAGSVTNDLDCDDADGDAYPGATWYLDADGDGYGSTTSTTACLAPANHVADNTDCDDTDAQINPVGTWYEDLDGDGVGGVQRTGCPMTGVLTGGDCDDNAGSVYPGAPDTCDGVDSDCDGTAEPDGDNDGYPICDDCDDADASTNPGAPEQCDNVDHDCDGPVDDAAVTTWYRDVDGDGYGTISDTQDACSAPSGYVGLSGDCDDLNGQISPAALEFCDGVDEDCDGVVDDRPENGQLVYDDLDGDGVGSTPAVVCTPGSNQVFVGGDCDDADALNWPGGTEVCDGRDNNCDTQVDEGLPLTELYEDADGDGFGGDNTQSVCGPLPGWVTDSTDCDDTSAEVYPGADEVPGNGIDEDCDGTDPEAPLGDSSVRTPDGSLTGEPVSTKPGPAGCDCDSGGSPSAGWLLWLLWWRRR